ncbi:MAG: DNA-directed RNA polymerase [Thermoplasmata archaeon]|nr:DNA-directed RNA polymerase [Thermoplasmata archaeon]MVT12801.1 DNA-directed RNA polymerase [Euryarchaeota archaeon]MVT15305.1 DNA-directed RNA polymerase [Euryarchaeota archaeon]MVT35459.1 DNA-directed RNA polymerase [Euryarchaeota archaeon]
MYMLLDYEDVIRIPPSMLGEDPDKIINELTYQKLEGRVKSFEKTEVQDPQERKFIIVAVLEVKRVGDGRIIPGDGGVYQKVEYKAIVFHPEMQEVVEGTVSDITNFGAFINFGVLDGLLHISQVMDDRFDIDLEGKRLIGKDTKKELRVKDKVRVRIVSLSLNDENLAASKIGLTMRQPGLGKLEDIKNEGT